MTRILVTGGAGFIGSHVVDALAARGDSVSVIDDFSRGKKENVPCNVPICNAQVESQTAREFVAAYRPTAIVHLAAQIDVGASLHDPLADAMSNVVGTVSIMQAALAAGTQAMVLTSSGGALYGDASVVPTPEDADARPLSPYGVSKLCAETYLDWANRCTPLRTVCLRFGNVFGPRQSHSGEAGVVSTFAERMLATKDVTIYGDGLQTRDFIDVHSVTDAVLLALDARSASGAFNIGSGIPCSIEALARSLQRETETKAIISYMPAKSNEVRHSCLDTHKATDRLGWRPRHAYAVAFRNFVSTLRGCREKEGPSTSKFASRLPESQPQNHV